MGRSERKNKGKRDDQGIERIEREEWDERKVSRGRGKGNRRRVGSEGGDDV